MRSCFAYHPDSLFDSKQRLLLGVVEYSYDQMIDQTRTPRNDIEMTVSERIERARIDSDKPAIFQSET